MIQASGTAGAVRVGYQLAMSIGAWSITAHRGSLAFRGRVVSENAYWAKQTPLDLVLWIGAAEWSWCRVTLGRDGQDVTAVLLVRPDVQSVAPMTAKSQGVRA